MLGSSPDPLTGRYDLLMLDLDGVVYVGGEAVPGAPEHLARAREAGARCAYVTNNASRPPSTVAAHLRRLGVEAEDDDVVTSAQAAARLLVQHHGAGATVLVLGGEGLWSAVRDAGLSAREVEPDHGADEGTPTRGEPAALVTGYGPEVRWREVMRAAVLVRDGLPWVASNTDLTIPSAYGTAPGHGVLVETLARFAEVEPVVAGKPAPPLLEATVARFGAQRPLMVGDRLDTDIEGGTVVGADTLLVMTGVTDAADLVAATGDRRATYVAADLGGLHVAHARPQAASPGDDWRHDGWSARIDADRLEIGGDGGSATTWWQLVAALGWDHHDRTGGPPQVRHLEPPHG